jgi:hypothetical protein
VANQNFLELLVTELGNSILNSNCINQEIKSEASIVLWNIRENFFPNASNYLLFRNNKQ